MAQVVPHTVTVTAEEDHDSTAVVWYFTFGANMNSHTLRSRGVYPSVSITGALSGYCLAFTYAGYEHCEPRFANIEKYKNETDGNIGRESSVSGASAYNPEKFDVQGVAHRITSLELQLLDGYEGCGVAYTRCAATFVPNTNTAGSIPILPGDMALPNLTESTASYSPYTAFMDVVAYTALPSHTTCPGLPSKRYIRLLVDGAAENSLPDEYIKTLRRLPCFDCADMFMPTASTTRATTSYTADVTSVTDTATSITMATMYQHSYDVAMSRRVTAAKSDDHFHGSAPAASDVGVWASMGGLVFDVSSGVHNRAMLRGISTAIDGTAFVLQLWANAYSGGIVPKPNFRVELTGCGGSVGNNTNDSGHMSSINSGLIDIRDLDPDRRAYVASWAHHMINKYPFIGRLRCDP